MTIQRYSAFLSYSHADKAVAAIVHRALETYRVPKALVGTATPLGVVQRRLLPVFRDREELPASGDLGGELRAALASARHLIVLASPAAARSRWVNEEILAFKRARGAHRVLVLIVDGEPGDPERECFPPALRFQLDEAGELTDIPAEPIAADVRKGGDGRRLALLKLVAGLTGLPLDALARRDAARRQRRMAWVASVMSGAFLMTLLLALYANEQRVEAVRQKRIAEAQTRTAEASLDFLIGTYQIANPATENPRTISALTILGRVSDRVRTELLGQPGVSARLLRTTGDIYANLGLPAEAERDLLAALALMPRTGEERAGTLLRLATVKLKAGALKESARLVAEAERSFANASNGPLALRARVAETRALLDYLGGRLNEAIAAFKKADALYGQATGNHEVDRARVLSNEGQALVRLGQFANADEVFAQVERIYARTYGRDHVQTAIATQNRAFGAFEAGRMRDAEKLVGQAAAVFDRVLEPNHPYHVQVEVLRGRTLHAKGDLAGARTAFDKAEGVAIALYGRRSLDVGDVIYYAAQVRSDAGRTDEALAMLDVGQRAYLESYGADHIDQAGLLLIRAQALRAADRIRETELACDAALAMLARLDDATLGEARTKCAALLATPPKIALRFGGTLGSPG